MNKIMQDYYPIFREYQALRIQLMNLLTDTDLLFRPSENNNTMGALCREIGETEVAYIESFKTFKSDFSYRQKDADELEGSVSRLQTWYAELDTQLEHVVSSLSDEDIDTREIEHGGFNFPINFHLTVYAEALIIFYGKVSIYLKAMGIEMPEQWRDWIG